MACIRGGPGDDTCMRLEVSCTRREARKALPFSGSGLDSDGTVDPASTSVTGNPHCGTRRRVCVCVCARARVCVCVCVRARACVSE